MNEANIYQPTTLGFALLGLVYREPRSGYALLKMFETTPIGHFSSSPGAIYPALRKLRQHNLITEEAGEPQGRRRGKIFHITTEGRDQLVAWLRQPVVHDDIIWRRDELILRFAFMEGLVTLEEVKQFLTSFIRCINLYVQTLTTIQASGEIAQASQLSDLALQNGIEVYKAHVKWAREALKVL